MVILRLKPLGTAGYDPIIDLPTYVDDNFRIDNGSLALDVSNSATDGRNRPNDIFHSQHLILDSRKMSHPYMIVVSKPSKPLEVLNLIGNH